MGPMYASQPQPLAMAQPTMQRVRTPYGWITINVQPQVEQQPEVSTHRRQFSRGNMSAMCQDDAMMGGHDMVMDEAMDVQMATPVCEQRFFDNSCNKRKRLDDEVQPMWRSEGKIRRIASMRGPSSIQQQSFFPSPFQVATFQSSPFGTPTKQPFGGASCRTCHSSPRSHRLHSAYISCSRCGSWTCNVCQRHCATWDCQYNGDTICGSCAHEDQDGAATCRDCVFGGR